MAVGETLEMEWTPERAGNWLFHCHMVSHMSPDTESPRYGQHQHGVDASAGMAGLVVGIRVAGAAPTFRNRSVGGAKRANVVGR